MSLRTRLAAWALRGIHPRDPALVEWLGGMNTAAGVTVTARNAMQIAAVYSCIRVLSESVAGLPLILYKRLPGGKGKKRATEHWLYPLLHTAPNAWMTSFGWREMGVMHMCLRGVSLTRLVPGPRGRRALVPLHPDNVRTFVRSNGELAHEHRKPDGGTEILLADEMVRIPFATLDGVEPITPIQAQRETLGEALAAQDYGARFWKNDARPGGGWIETEGVFKDDTARKSIVDFWREATTGAKKHSTPFLPKGMKYHPMSMNMADSQFIDSRKMKRAEIAGLFRVPPHMIGDLDRATFANIEQQGIDFVIYSLMGWLRRWEQGLSLALLEEREREEFFVEFLVDGLLRGDAAARANYFRTAILTGWMNRNEVREIENFNHVEGLDEYLAPMNMAPADMLASIIGAKATPTPAPPAPANQKPTEGATP